MDRFEGITRNRRQHPDLIYIPVWIDLKDVKSLVARIGHMNLHSSMDRFEDRCISTSYKVYLIYIPVWIDLKNELLMKTMLD